MNRTLLRSVRCLALLVVAVTVAPTVAEDPLSRALAEQRQRALVSPGDATVQNDFGNLLALAGDTAAAEAAYRQALASDPSFATAHYNLGRLLSRQERYWAARRELKRAIGLEPGNADAHYHLGVVYAAWGLDRLATRAYARAFELDPRLADPSQNPHVLENRHALAAQLMAWQAERVPGPTRRYDDAAAIATRAQLPPAEPSSQTTGPAPEASAEPEASTGGGFARSSGGPVVNRDFADAGDDAGARGDSKPDQRRESGDRATTTRVLGASDLRGNSGVNQVVAPGASGRRDAGAGNPARDRNPTFRPSRFSTSRIERGIEVVDSTAIVIAG